MKWTTLSALILATSLMAHAAPEDPRVIAPATTGSSPTTPFGINRDAYIPPATTGFSPTTPFGINRDAYIPPATTGYSSSTPFGAQAQTGPNLESSAIPSPIPGMSDAEFRRFRLAQLQETLRGSRNHR